MIQEPIFDAEFGAASCEQCAHHMKKPQYAYEEKKEPEYDADFDVDINIDMDLDFGTESSHEWNSELARAYVPFQRDCKMFCPEDSLKKGTVFPALYCPYESHHLHKK